MRHGRSLGAVVAPQPLYNLGLEWYATRLDRDWHRTDPREAEHMFAKHGLTGPFWSLG